MIKLIKLKSGEDLIGNIEEMVIENKPVGYFLIRPCIVNILENVDDPKNRNGYRVELFSWIPLSKEEKIPIPIDWVVTITNPVDTLMEMYTKDILDKEENGKNS
jgi:hypothetical protein